MPPLPTSSACPSIFRGYAASGLGDGPGRPIARGEQFLSADPPFAEDSELLSALRPWLTLDLAAGDHRLLGDRLEAWSSFTHGAWAVVARLIPAGTFDQRAAYFSHARAFPADAVEGPADPGSLLGRSDAFEAPWQEGRPSEGVPAPAPEMVRPEQVAAEPETAAALLAHALQGLLSRRPVVVAVPVEELVAGAPLHALVSFARAALPPRLKRDYRLRVYTRSPELFLGRLDSHLLVVPETAASDALAVRRDAVLLDRRARRHAGTAPEPAIEGWAKKVVLWACERPGALLEFAARYGNRVWDGSAGPPGEREVVSIAVTYRLAEELAGDREPSRNLLGQLRNATARLKPGTIPWSRLLGAEELSRFPRREVLELVLADPDGLPAGVRELQAAATQAATDLGWSAGELVADDGLPMESGGLKRLLDLSSRARGLVPAEALRRQLLEVPLRRLKELGLLSQLLQSEDGLDAVAARAEELLEVPELLKDEVVRALVVDATLSGRLDPAILEGIARRIGTPGLGGRWPDEWLGSLDTDRLLRLASSVAPGGSGSLEGAVAEVLLGRMRRDPAETGAQLVRRGAWSWWRRRAPAQPSEARAWALAWLESPVWEELPQVDPRLEDWELVVEDLGDRLEGREVMALLGNGRRAWPWVPLFADRQVEDLARRMPDLGALAILVERSPREGPLSRPEVEEGAFRAFAADRPALCSLGPESLRWVGETPEPSTLPALSATGLQLVYREAGPRRAQMVENLAGWIESGGLADGSREDLLPWIDRLGQVRRTQASNRAQAVARQLAERGHRGTARLLDPELDTRLEDRAAARRLLDALASGRLDDPIWLELQRKLVSYRQGAGGQAVRHPFQEVADGLADESGPSEGLWRRFAALMDRYPGLFYEADEGGQEPLPAFALAATLFESLSAGALAVRLAFAAPYELSHREGWWSSLLESLNHCRRRSGRRSGLDRPDVARALLARIRHDLPEPSRAALGRALWFDLDRADPPGGGP